MNYFKVNKKKLTFYLILIIAAFPDFLNYKIAYVFYLFVFIINIELFIKKIPEYFTVPLPLVFFFCWLYGALIGLYNGYGFDALNNFFGLSLLLTTYILICRRFTIQDIAIIVIYAGISQALYQLVHIVILIIEGTNIVNYFIQDSIMGIADYRINYSVGIIFTIAAFNLLTILKENFSDDLLLKYVIRNKWIIGIFLLIAILITGSKGTYAAIAFTLLIRYLIYNFNPVKFLLRTTLLFVIAMALRGSFIENVLNTSFDKSEVNNVVREEQSQLIMNEWTFFGKGLGAPLSSGFTRGSTKYGMELTYHSIIHKLGYIIGGFLIICLFFLYVKSIVRFWRKSNISDAVAFSLMACLIPAYGNPSLFSPYSVIAICIAMYCLKIDTYTKKPKHFEVGYQ